MANKMIDLAVCGRVVTTPEIHEAAIEKYGIASKRRNMYTTYDMLKSMWTNEATVKRTIDISNNYTLNANEFDTSHDLYGVLDKKYGEIFPVSHHTRRIEISKRTFLIKLISSEHLA